MNELIQMNDGLADIKTKSSFIKGFGESRIGGRAENQDNWGFSDTPFGFLLVVCDGMGGGPSGKLASKIAVDSIIKGVEEGDKEEAPTNVLIKAIRQANMDIILQGEEDMRLKGMGSTCTAVLVNEESAIVAHVGDSRVYQFRGGYKVFRTFDHSMVFDLVKKKVITEEVARLSVDSNIITRALGIKPDLEVEVHEVPYEAGDRFMLSTDGIHGAVPEKQLISMATGPKKNLSQCVEDMAMTIDNEGIKNGGGHDNLTVAMIELSANSKMKVKMSKRVKYIFLGLLIVCVCSLSLNMCQAFSTKEVDLKKVVPEKLREYKGSAEGENYAKEIVDSIGSVYPDVISSQKSDKGKKQ